MSRNTKIVLGVIGGILVACCLLVAVAVIFLPNLAENFLEQSFTEDPAQAEEVAQSIVDYELPAGFDEEGAMSFFGIQTVFISSENNAESMIMLMEFPEGMAGNEEQMREQMEEAFASQIGAGNYDVEFVESREATINDEPATLGVYEGSDDQGNEVRQIIGVFESKSGNTAMMMIFGTLRNWDNNDFDDFIDSLQ